MWNRSPLILSVLQTINHQFLLKRHTIDCMTQFCPPLILKIPPAIHQSRSECPGIKRTRCFYGKSVSNQSHFLFRYPNIIKTIFINPLKCHLYPAKLGKLIWPVRTKHQRSTSVHELPTNLHQNVPLSIKRFVPRSLPQLLQSTDQFKKKKKCRENKKNKIGGKKSVSDLRRVEIARCFEQRFTTSPAEKYLVPASGHQRLTAYYGAEPIYRAPVSNRDLFEGSWLSRRKRSHPRRGIHFKGQLSEWFPGHDCPKKRVSRY